MSTVQREIETMAAFAELRKLAVAHQVWGECRWCDRRFNLMIEAALAATRKLEGRHD